MLFYQLVMIFLSCSTKPLLHQCDNYQRCMRNKFWYVCNVREQWYEYVLFYRINDSNLYVQNTLSTSFCTCTRKVSNQKVVYTKYRVLIGWFWSTRSKLLWPDLFNLLEHFSFSINENKMTWYWYCKHFYLQIDIYDR